MEIINYSYNGSEISFSTGENVMVNATQMAKPFGKRSIDWLNLPSTTQFIDSLIAVRKSHRSELIKTINGVGTWMHEDVALEFARWLSPAFAIWCNDRIKELLKTGVTTISNDDETILHAMQVLQKRVEENKQRVQILEGENEHLNQEVRQLAPKAEYTDNVLQSVSTYTMTQVAKELGMSAVALEKKLHEGGIMFRQSGQWILYAKYQDKGYTKPRTHHYTHSDGTTGTNTITVWTEKGRKFIHEVIRKQKPDYIRILV